MGRHGGLTMSLVTPKQIAKTINLIADSGIDSAHYQALLESGRFSALLREFMEDKSESGRPEPTIIPLKFAGKYSDFRRRYPTLVEARNAMRLDGDVEQEVNDTNFPPEGRDGDREFVLVCFHRDIDDHEEDPEKSELLRELDKLGLQSEGPMELCFVGTDEWTRDLQRQFCIAARRQVWWRLGERFDCPILDEDNGRYLTNFDCPRTWDDNCWFLASRK